MSLTRVEITSEVFWVCTNHALTTEAEEIMGLLLGDVSDRVEASPEQLSRCAAAAEQFTQQGGVRTRVIGWYHSHPHITVLPSHVDIKTQAAYQMLDDGFVGLIFSTFDEDSRTKAQSISVTAFQSVPSDERLSPAPSLTLGRLSSMDSDMAQAIQLSLAEARNSASAGSVQWQRKGVPLHIVKSQGPMEHTLTDLVALAKVLYQEEQKAFHAAMEEDTDREGTINPLAAIQHGSTYQQNLCRLMELVLGPMLRSIQTCCSQQQLQKQFGNLGNSVYNMQVATKAASQPAEQAAAAQSLSASMAELLEISGPNVGSGATPNPSEGMSTTHTPSQGVGVTPNPSGNWDPSAALHLYQSHNQQQLQPQLQQQQLWSQLADQRYQSQPQAQSSAYSQSWSHSQPDAYTQAQPASAPQYAPDSPFRDDSQQHALLDQQSQGIHSVRLPAEVSRHEAYQRHDQANPNQWQQTELHQSQPAQGLHAQPVSVSIISPAIWASQDKQHGAAPSYAESAQDEEQRQGFLPSAPAASTDDLASAYRSSSNQSSPHLPQKVLPDSNPHLAVRPPLAGNDNRRSIATNTQLTMHRGSSDAQRSNATPSNAVPSSAAVSAPPLRDWSQSSSSANNDPGSSSSIPAQSSGYAHLHSQTLQPSRSASSLNLLPSGDGLEGRSSGQPPMRAGSPALGGQSFPKPPTWSPRLHDPFGELVHQDLKRAGSSQSNTSIS